MTGSSHHISAADSEQPLLEISVHRALHMGDTQPLMWLLRCLPIAKWRCLLNLAWIMPMLGVCKFQCTESTVHQVKSCHVGLLVPGISSLCILFGQSSYAPWMCDAWVSSMHQMQNVKQSLIGGCTAWPLTGYVKIVSSVSSSEYTRNNSSYVFWPTKTSNHLQSTHLNNQPLNGPVCDKPAEEHLYRPRSIAMHGPQMLRAFCDGWCRYGGTCWAAL